MNQLATGCLNKKGDVVGWGHKPKALDVLCFLQCALVNKPIQDGGEAKALLWLNQPVKWV